MSAWAWNMEKLLLRETSAPTILYDIEIESTDIQNNFMNEINMLEKFEIPQYHFVILIN